MEDDPEIPVILKQLEAAGQQQKAWDELQRYRAEALTIAVLYAGEGSEEKIEEARETLKERLKKLLG